VEGQAWWIQTPGRTGSSFGHVHVGACVPERENMRASFTLDYRIILHDNPGVFQRFEVWLMGHGYGIELGRFYLPGFTCPVGTCVRWLRVPIDLSRFPYSGLQEIKTRAIVKEPDGNTMKNSLHFQIYVRNGQPFREGGIIPYLRTEGWYKNAGYCEARLKSVPVPDRPVARVWKPYVWMEFHDSPGDHPVSHHMVTLDADFHAGMSGMVLNDGPGAWEGPQPIDTTKLRKGPHKLLLRASCDDPRGSTSSGVLVVHFAVRR
jgi:hypothetical protein